MRKSARTDLCGERQRWSPLPRPMPSKGVNIPGESRPRYLAPIRSSPHAPLKSLGLIGNAPAPKCSGYGGVEVRRSIFDKTTWGKPSSVWQDDCFMGIESTTDFRGTLPLGAT
jgi:hypothetical protein